MRRLDFNPRAPCGARRSGGCSGTCGSSCISIHVPLAGHDVRSGTADRCTDISIHVPLAGHDPAGPARAAARQNFNPRAPCGARQRRMRELRRENEISIHVPLAGHDEWFKMSSSFCSEFQSTCPLRGTTQIPFSLIAIIVFQSTCPLRGTTLTAAMLQKYSKYDFNPRAPCGARHDFLHFIRQNRKFQSTCPLRGTTRNQVRTMENF